MSQLQLSRVTGVARPNTTIDIIFVHGLGGTGEQTWTAGTNAFWPLWIFEDLTSAEVWTLEYPASIFGSANGSIVISDQAKQVLDLLSSRGIGTRPVVFIAHSLGGLLVKQMLRTAVELHKPTWKLVATNTRGVLFLATPHSGSAIATIASKFPLVSRATMQIAANDPNLLALRDWYRENVAALGLATHAYCETKPHKGLVIVDKASADPGVLGCIKVECDGDHASICKPTTRDSPIYVGARKFISDLIGTKTRRSSIPSSAGSPRTELDERRQDDAYEALANEFENYTTPKDEPRLDLAEKLRLGGRSHEIPRALRLKEEFAKTFARNQLQSSATQRYIKLLAEVDSRFNSDVYPAIVNGASTEETAALIKTHISDPIIEVHRSDPLVNHVVLDRMIYYLTGICHIRWSP